MTIYDLVSNATINMTRILHKYLYFDIDVLLSPLLDPLEGQIMLSCGKLGLEGRSRLTALKGGRGAC